MLRFRPRFMPRLTPSVLIAAVVFLWAGHFASASHNPTRYVPFNQWSQPWFNHYDAAGDPFSIIVTYQYGENTRVLPYTNGYIYFHYTSDFAGWTGRYAWWYEYWIHAWINGNWSYRNSQYRCVWIGQQLTVFAGTHLHWAPGYYPTSQWELRVNSQNDCAGGAGAWNWGMVFVPY